MPLKSLFCLEDLFLMLQDTISLSRFAQAKGKIRRRRLTSGHEKTPKFGANSTRHDLFHLFNQA
jgi:hypothetical protein